LKPGEVSNVVKSQFGYHIIKVEDRKAAGAKPFDDAKAEIRMQLATARADSTSRTAADLLGRALARGGDEKVLAAGHGGVVAASPISATEPIPSLGFPQGLATDLPAMVPGKWAPGFYRTGNHYLVVRLRERIAPRPAEFGEVTAQATEDMKNTKRRVVLAQKVEAVRSSLASGGSLDSLAAPFGGLKDSGYLGASAGYVPLLGAEPRVVQRAIAMKPGQVSDTLQVAAGVVWLRVEDHKSGDAATYKAAAAQIEAEIATKKYNAWVDERKKIIKVEILRPDLRAPRPPVFGAK
jgi:peptidyl-prolyl cis-trans isomerase D